MTAMRIVYFRRAEEELTRVHLYNARSRSPVWGMKSRLQSQGRRSGMAISKFAMGWGPGSG
jgi:hypothetical protein